MKKNKGNLSSVDDAFKEGRVLRSSEQACGLAKTRLYGSSTPIMENKALLTSCISDAFGTEKQIPPDETRDSRASSGARHRRSREPFAPAYRGQAPDRVRDAGIRDDSRAGPGTERRDVNRAKNKELDAKSLWIQVEDVLVPGLRLSVIDHVVYTHLLRHSRLEGKRRLRFSIPWLARNIHLSTCPTREAVRRLAAQGALRLVERSKQGHVAEVRLPEEIRGVRSHANRAREAVRLVDASDLETMDFLKTLELRRTIHAREGGKCFYCLKRIPPRLACLDHVVPRAKVRCNSYRNLVSCCMECNSEKGEKPAEEFLRWLFRERQLGAADLKGRFRALELLAAGKLRPVMPSEGG